MKVEVRAQINVVKEIIKLENTRLIHSNKRGKNHEFFLSMLSKEVPDQFMPLSAEIDQKPKWDFKHVDPTHLQRLMLSFTTEPQQ